MFIIVSKMMSYTKTLLTILLLGAVMGVSFWIAFDKSYAVKVAGVEQFVAPTVDTTDTKPFHEDINYCPTDLRYDIYRLQEKYFKDTQDLVIKTVIHYFPNADTSTLNDSLFHQRVDLMNQFFKGSGAGLTFEIDSVVTHLNKPSDNSRLLKSIASFETFLNKKRKDLRDNYYGEHVDFHNNILASPKALNIYVYNDDTDFSGRAGDIESTYFAVNLKYMHPELYTFEHEAGHCYGLYHTHALDNSGETHSTDGGDFICETHVTFPLNSIVGDSCELMKDWEKELKLPPYSNPISSWDEISAEDIELLIKNVMSYTRHQCRQEFSDEQVRRMRKILENNKDLRATIKGLDTDLKTNILRNLAEIDS